MYVCCKNRIDFVLGSSLFMASVSSVLHFKSVGYESVFADILIGKCLTVLMYDLDAVSLESNSIKLVTQVWNCGFRWLYGVGEFTSTTNLFDSHGPMYVIFLLQSNILALYACMQSTENDLLMKLFCIDIMTRRFRICMRPTF